MIEITEAMRKAKTDARALAERFASPDFSLGQDWNDVFEMLSTIDGPSMMVWARALTCACNPNNAKNISHAGPAAKALQAWNQWAATGGGMPAVEEPRFHKALKTVHAWKEAVTHEEIAEVVKWAQEP